MTMNRQIEEWFIPQKNWFARIHLVPQIKCNNL